MAKKMELYVRTVPGGIEYLNEKFGHDERVRNLLR